jgi:hypothetical protein
MRLSNARSAPVPMCARDDDGLARALRVADTRVQNDDIEWLSRGFRAYLASKGTVPLERCLRLPSGDAALSRARRDHWLRQAWNELGAQTTPWQRSELLAEMINRFRSLVWPRWQSLGCPPAAASPLEAALFEAFRSHERVPSTAMQLHTISQQHR